MTFSDDFLFQVRLHQLSVKPFHLSYYWKTLSREIRSGCPEELFHADVLELVSETLEDL